MKYLWIVILLLVLCCAFVHRRVIKAIFTGSEMPKAPSWHIWVAKDKRKDN